MSKEQGTPGTFLLRGAGCGGFLVLPLLFGFADQPRAECDTREHHTIPWFAALCEPLVRAIGMQAERLFLPIKAADGTAPVLGMEDQRDPLEPQGARAAPWIASPSLCRLQRVQLATHEPGARSGYHNFLQVGFSAPQELACLGGCARHQWSASRIDDWDAHKGFPFTRSVPG